MFLSQRGVNLSDSLFNRPSLSFFLSFILSLSLSFSMILTFIVNKQKPIFFKQVLLDLRLITLEAYVTDFFWL